MEQEHATNIEVEVEEHEPDLQQMEDYDETKQDEVPSALSTSEAQGILKPKKPRSQKQLEAFEKCRLARQKKIHERKTAPKPVKKKQAKTKSAKPKIVYLPQQNDESSDEEQEEIVYIPKQKSKKKKVKKTRIVYMDSETESEEEETFYVDEQPKSRPSTPEYQDPYYGSMRFV